VVVVFGLVSYKAQRHGFDCRGGLVGRISSDPSASILGTSNLGAPSSPRSYRG
jgi:hypothetical protein